MARAALGFVVAVVVWVPAFFLLAGVGSWLWPEYALTRAPGPGPAPSSSRPRWRRSTRRAGRRPTCSRGGSPSPSGGGPGAASAFAAVAALYAGAVHLCLSWSDYRWWYNVAVTLAAAPAALLGGRLARRFVGMPEAARAA